MDFDVIYDNLLYFLVGAYPHGPLGGAALTLLLSVLSAGLSAVLGLAFGIAWS
ncbi:glutamate transport membrane-spanning protein [Alcaligenes sp. HPC1271]|nr:glutamate transport membrane-spanning protein [Alcaligenes sp. HPC1271]